MSEDTAALLARWDAAHVLHQEDPCDCGDGFGGCGHVGCYECGQEWPCEGVLEALGFAAKEQYAALEAERFDLIYAAQQKDQR